MLITEAWIIGHHKCGKPTLQAWQILCQGSFA
jgi:hypothetical protein